MRHAGTGHLGTLGTPGTQLSQLLEVTVDLNVKGHITQVRQSSGLPGRLDSVHPSIKT